MSRPPLSISMMFLCVGGPCGGQRRWGDIAAGFRAAISEPAIVSDVRGELEGLGPTVRFVVYKCETFYSPQGNRSFWVPEGQSSLETLDILVRAYERGQQ